MTVELPKELKPFNFPDEVRRANMADTLSRNPNGDDIWIFGYGSLMWDPRFEPAEKRIATLNDPVSYTHLTLPTNREV